MRARAKRAPDVTGPGRPPDAGFTQPLRSLCDFLSAPRRNCKWLADSSRVPASRSGADSEGAFSRSCGLLCFSLVLDSDSCCMRLFNSRTKATASRPTRTHLPRHLATSHRGCGIHYLFVKHRTRCVSTIGATRVRYHHLPGDAIAGRAEPLRTGGGLPHAVTHASRETAPTSI